MGKSGKKVKSSSKAAWDAFSQWVKVSGCIETTNLPFVGECITHDGRRYHITYLEAGHAIGGRHNAILFHEKLTNPQCRYCNQIMHGRYKKYKKVLIAKHSEKEVNKWIAEANQVIHDYDMDFPAIAKKYKAKTTELLLPFGYATYEEMLQGHQL